MKPIVVAVAITGSVPRNAEIVALAAETVSRRGAQPATPAEARTLLGVAA